VLKKAVIAVDDSLGPYRQALSRAGYEVVNLRGEPPHNAAALVVNGIDDRVLGIETAMTPAPIINADGLSVEQVLREVARRVET
jgi:hypothetical protein